MRMKWVVRVFLLLVLAAIVIPGLWLARPAPDGQGGLSEIRTLMTAEDSYANVNKGYFDSPRCLGVPAACLPNVPRDMQPFLDRRMAELQPWGGYTFQFHAGPPPAIEFEKEASKSSVTSYAVVALPLKGSGSRAFCGDSMGRLCERADGTMPGVENGRCPDACETLR